jgi:hypothetical protein
MSGTGNNTTMNMGALQAALRNIEANTAYPPKYAMKKKKRNITRKNVKKRNTATKSNRIKARLRNIKRKLAQRRAERRIKPEFTTTSIGIHGLDELSDALGDFKYIYRKSNAIRQSNLDSYLIILTTSIQEAFQKELSGYEISYLDLFNETLAIENPLSYLSKLNIYIQDRLEEYDVAINEGNEAKQIEMDTIGEIIIDAANKANRSRNNLKENNDMKNLLGAFGTFRI